MAELVEAAETVEEAVEVVRELSRPHPYLVAGLIGVSAAAGVAVGYYVAKRKLETKYDEIAQQEIAEMRAHYTAKTEATMGRITKPQLETVIKELRYRDANSQIEDFEPAEDEEEIVSKDIIRLAEENRVSEVQNIFTSQKAEIEELSPDMWDYAIEIKNRSPEVPYVIHFDEFVENQADYDTTNLTYYEEDDILADTDDSIIEDQDALICLGNLNKFGHGSNDPNIVYIRNDERQLLIEVCRSGGSYAEEVHGIKHSDESRHSRPDWDG